MKKLSLFCLAIAPLFFALPPNPLNLNLSSIIGVLSSAWLFVFIVYFLTRNFILTTVFFWLFFSYGHLWILLTTLFVGDYQLCVNSFLPFIYVAFLIIFLKFFHKQPHQITKKFIVINWLILILAVLTFGYRSLSAKSLANKYQTAQPDIYYLIFDEYARTDVLKEQLDFDNSPFLNFLKSKGFYLPAKTHGNYPITYLSLSSSLNMDYLDNLLSNPYSNSRNRSEPYRLINNSQARQFLTSKGYQYIDLSDGWQPLKNYHDDQNQAFIRNFAATTALNPLLTADLLAKFIPSFLRPPGTAESILSRLNRLLEIPEISTATFTFLHVKLPHHTPYHFDRYGQPIRSLNLPDKKLYLEQLLFANQQIEAIVTAILAKSAIEPIIIIQGDTGSRFLKQQFIRSVEQLTSDQIRERFGIFNAYYLPDGGDQYLYDSISPVNSFRIILNHYFNQNLPLLEDKSYFATYKHPYQFSPL